MKDRLTEESVLFISVLKWFVLATLIGVLVGFSTTAFLKVLQWSFGVASTHTYYFLTLPVAMVASVLLIKFLAPDAKGHGTEKVIEAIHKRSGKIPAAVVPVKLVATVVTLTAGGSVGKEGPCAQIGAGVASLAADLLRMDDHDRKKIVICGISAGFAAVFGTPIAGAIFGIEVLVVGGIFYEVLFPSFIAGITAYQISAWLGTKYFSQPINFVPVFTESFFVKVLVAGVFFGLCSFLLVEILKSGERLAERIRLTPWLKALLGGLVLVGLTFVFSTDYLGLGLDTVQASLQGKDVKGYAFLVKAIFTSITLSFGGSGGIVTPIFFVGSTAGSLYGHVLGLDPGTFAALGLVSLLAGAANTPIAASIMAIELFGPQIGPYAAVACVISFLMTGHRSVYPSQVLAMTKSESLQVSIGKEMQQISTEFKVRRGGLLVRTMIFFRYVWAVVKSHRKPNGDTDK
jgi:H+/Cl- antiporter ClcA